MRPSVISILLTRRLRSIVPFAMPPDGALRYGPMNLMLVHVQYISSILSSLTRFEQLCRETLLSLDWSGSWKGYRILNLKNLGRIGSGSLWRIRKTLDGPFAVICQRGAVPAAKFVTARFWMLSTVLVGAVNFIDNPRPPTDTKHTEHRVCALPAHVFPQNSKFFHLGFR